MYDIVHHHHHNQSNIIYIYSQKKKKNDEGYLEVNVLFVCSDLFISI